MAKQITDYANEVLNEKRLKDMRDSIAGGLLTSASLATDSKQSSERVLAKQNALEQRFINLQQATTDGDFNSAPEIIDARGGKATLGQRLDETTAQLAHTVPQVAYNQLGVTGIKRDIPLMSIVDDDGSSAFLTKLLPVAQKYNIPMVSSVILDTLLGSSGMNVEDVLDLQNNHNIEIASHSSNHAIINSALSEEEQYNEVYGSMSELRKLGLTIDTFVYPYGESTTYARSLVSKYYKSGVSTDARLNGTPLNTQRLGRHEFPKSGWTFNDYKNLIDGVKTTNQWVIWMLHCANMTQTDVEMLDQLIAYTLNQNIEIVSVSEGIDIVGNYLDINEQNLYIAKNGKNNIRDLIYEGVDNATGRELHDASSPPSSFESRKETVNYLFSAQGLVNAPTSAGGYLYTIKHADNSQVFQEFKSYSSKWIRYSTSDTWTPWYKISKIDRISKSVAEITIPANSGHNLAISDPLFRPAATYSAAPAVEPSSGIVWNIIPHGSGAVKVRFFNVTSAPITMSARDWFISIFE